MRYHYEKSDIYYSLHGITNHSNENDGKLVLIEERFSDFYIECYEEYYLKGGSILWDGKERKC